MDLNKTLTYILLFFCLQISGQGLLIKWDSPSGFGDVKYGYMYNWYVTDSIANTSDGWRVPDDADWDTLITYLGGDSVAGGKLKETGFEYWEEPNTGATNEVGFNARGGSYRLSTGLFSQSALLRGYWWSATEVDATNARYIIMFHDQANVINSSASKLNGLSLRTMRDSTSTETGMSDGRLIPNAYTGNDGKKYDGVKIGSQVWITANLAETKYNNGTDILEVTDNTAWTELTTGARCSYDNDESNAIFSDGQLIKWDEPRYRAVDSIDIKYGYLYNWYVTANIAATGWRVPSDADWDTLIAYLGADAGSKLAGSYELWTSGVLRDNANFDETGFNGLPGGIRDDNGLFDDIGISSIWWSATENVVSSAFYRFILYNDTGVGGSFLDKEFGFSVRVMRDTITGETHGDIIPNAYTGNDGKKYDGVVIGTQVWINQNLIETKYNNDTPIIEVTDNTDWSNLTTGARCSYNNIESNAFELVEAAGLYAESRPDLIKYDFDVPAHSRLLFPSDTTHMAGSFVNDTFRIEKWYDYIKRDSLVQANIALQPWFDFADGSVRFDGGQRMSTGKFYDFMNMNGRNTLVWRALQDTTGGNTLINAIVSHGGDGTDAVGNRQRFISAFSNAATRIRTTWNYGENIAVSRSYVFTDPNTYYSAIIISDNNDYDAYYDGLQYNNASAIQPPGTPLNIGSLNPTSLASPLTGNIRTIILFDFPLNKAQRILTNKYLQK